MSKVLFRSSSREILTSFSPSFLVASTSGIILLMSFSDFDPKSFDMSCSIRNKKQAILNLRMRGPNLRKFRGAIISPSRPGRPFWQDQRGKYHEMPLHDCLIGGL